MKKMFKLGLVMLTVLALMLSVVGCGGGEKPAAENNEPAKDKIVASFEPTFAPFEFTDEKGEFTGFDIDLIKAIAEAEGFEVELKSLGFDGLIPAVQAGQIDVAISGMSIKPEREEQVNFSMPYYEAGLVIAVQQGNNDIETLEDLAGKSIAVQIGTTGADTANEVAEKYGATVKTYNTTDLVFMELINGGADAAINDLPVTQYAIAQKHEGKVKIVGDVINGEFENYGIAVSKEKAELLEKINNGLNTIKENGKYAEIYQKWFGEAPPEYLPGGQAK
jgi:polar amino acid transport system substrate-binding protein